MKESQQLHLIAFNIPFPANYGGVIDVFYKIKALHELGVEIHLHCFEYGRTESDVLLMYCKTVHYYKRKTGLLQQFSFKPYITNTRFSAQLLENLTKINAPILFEGLHCCYYLNHPDLKNDVKIVRIHNVEWEYYLHLAQLERQWIKKTYFLIESFRLKKYQSIIKYANQIIAISPQDEQKLIAQFPNQPIKYIPAFHPNETIKSQVGAGDYILFHGDLSVKDNEAGAIYLIEEVFKNGKIPMPLVIAGLNPSARLIQLAEKIPHVTIKANLSHEDLQNLICKAHINILISFQSAGMKLKLLNALFTGRFCVVNTPMIKDTGLADLCIVQDNAIDTQKELQQLCLVSFQDKDVQKRHQGLGKTFFNSYNAQEFLSLLKEH